MSVRRQTRTQKHAQKQTHTHTFPQKKDKPELINNFTCSSSCQQNSYTGPE